MDNFFYYSGVALWLVISVALLMLVVEILIGFVNAVSWARWAYRSAQVHGTKLHWKHFPLSFLSQWFEFIGYRNRGNMTITRTDGGVWRGIGDWTIAPKRAVPPYAPVDELIQ